MNELTISDAHIRIASADLAALVGSRLCHDLISPMGAIGNGVELLGLTGEWPGLASTPELKLITESVAAARARVRLFRLAFGTASNDQRLSQAEITAALNDAEQGGRLKYRLETSGDHARICIKMVLLGLMCLETALPWGGHVCIRQEAGQWQLLAEATRTRPDARLWSWLASSDADLTVPQPSASEVQFPLLAAEAARQGRNIRWKVGDSSAEITF